MPPSTRPRLDSTRPLFNVGGMGLLLTGTVISATAAPLPVTFKEKDCPYLFRATTYPTKPPGFCLVVPRLPLCGLEPSDV